MNKAGIVTCYDELAIVSDSPAPRDLLELADGLYDPVRLAAVDLDPRSRGHSVAVRGDLAEVEADDGSIRLDKDR